MADPVEERIARVERDPRKQWGWGPSALASNEEKDAWRVASGERPRDIRNDPAFREWAYNEGGYAKSRRTMRMQQEWQKQQEEDVKMQAALQAMDIQQKQFEMGVRDQQMQEDDFYYNRGLKEAEQKLKAQQLSEATAIIGGLNQLDPRDPEYQQKRAKIFGDNPLGSADPNVQKVATEYSAVNEIYSNAMKEQATGIKEAQEKYAEDMQKLMESGVTEAELPQYINPQSPVGLPMFDPLKVAAKLGETKAQEKAEAKTTKEETPKEKINLDLQQAYGELNEILMAGGDPESASSKVAGLRARYKAATGEDAPEVFPRPQTPKQKERLPSGAFYYDPQGVLRQKP